MYMWQSVHSPETKEVSTAQRRNPVPSRVGPRLKADGTHLTLGHIENSSNGYQQQQSNFGVEERASGIQCRKEIDEVVYLLVVIIIVVSLLNLPLLERPEVVW